MKTLLMIGWGATLIGGFLGIAQLWTAVGAGSAPQQTAGAVLALAFVVVPYSVAQALEGLARRRGDDLVRRPEPVAAAADVPAPVPAGDSEFSPMAKTILMVTLAVVVAGILFFSLHR